ncbi:MAG TPA: thioesterase family protein [Chitinophagaceae bacterium]|jgi:YbgC/YbaW family acyl-CoA thioester hydrolase
MPRIKIDLPGQFHFSTLLPVRITDVNYGGHVGNDTILSLIHEARMQYLHHFGYTELNLGGAGLIMSDVGIEFKSELFYGDTVKASVAIAELSKISFELYYKLEKEVNGKTILVAVAKTGMVCFDYEKKKVIAIPDEVRNKLATI